MCVGRAQEITYFLIYSHPYLYSKQSYLNNASEGQTHEYPQKQHAKDGVCLTRQK